MVLLPRSQCLTLLQELGHLMGLEHLKQVHGQMIISGLCRQSFAVSKLVELYCFDSSGCERRGYARCIYRQAEEPERQMIRNIMIRYSTPQEAIMLFAHGIERGIRDVADKFTFTFVLGACARSSALLEGRQIHAQILKTGIASDIAVRTSGVHFYASCKDIDSARQLFDEIPVKSIASWNAIIAGYSSQGPPRSHEYAYKALGLFLDMLIWLPEGVKPTETTMVVLLSACSHLGVLAAGSCIHGYICKTIPSPEGNVFIGTGLVDMYSKCGCLSSSSQLFERMKKRNVLTWTAMMAGLAIHGQGKEAMELLDAMVSENVAPNAVTFTCLLNACRHTGLVEEGLHLFERMNSKFGIAPSLQHYGCIADLLGRAGQLEEAYKFVSDMPLKPDAILWRTLLGACKTHGNAELGEKVGKLLLQLEQGHSDLPAAILPTSEDYVALSNMYASAGRWDNVGEMREMMKVKGIQNRPGCSAIQVCNSVNSW
eukprot:TRINITY_DN10361_c1_g1_i3.p1 TRINITY_DN10361_c1_g1~~TRINITY_DN10361_c1_g1_i3.p1  ORF type:complete len:485 (+),score=84.05 TRINITY_DN10361_c1_g1_i3:437-1891(+)